MGINRTDARSVEEIRDADYKLTPAVDGVILRGLTAQRTVTAPDLTVAGVRPAIGDQYVVIADASALAFPVRVATTNGTLIGYVGANQHMTLTWSNQLGAYTTGTAGDSGGTFGVGNPDYLGERTFLFSAPIVANSPHASDSRFRFVFTGWPHGLPVDTVDTDGDGISWGFDACNARTQGQGGGFYFNTGQGAGSGIDGEFAVQSDARGTTSFSANPWGVLIGGLASSSFPLYRGGGIGVLGIVNAQVVPSASFAQGVQLYAQAGAAKVRGAGGTVTTFGPSDPHCPDCGRDFAMQWENEANDEHLAICMACVVAELEALGVKRGVMRKRLHPGKRKPHVAEETKHHPVAARLSASRA